MPSQRNSHGRRGWGLIEVVAALAILAGAAVLLFDAQIRSLDQIKHAQDVRQAKQLAEDLIARWRREGYPSRAVEAGTFGDQAPWRWQLAIQKVRPIEASRPIEMYQVHLEMQKTNTKDIQQGQEAILSLTWLVPSLGAGTSHEPSS